MSDMEQYELLSAEHSELQTKLEEVTRERDQYKAQAKRLAEHVFKGDRVARNMGWHPDDIEGN